MFLFHPAFNLRIRVRVRSGGVRIRLRVGVRMGRGPHIHRIHRGHRVMCCEAYDDIEMSCTAT